MSGRPNRLERWREEPAEEGMLLVRESNRKTRKYMVYTTGPPSSWPIAFKPLTSMICGACSQCSVTVLNVQQAGQSAGEDGAKDDSC